MEIRNDFVLNEIKCDLWLAFHSFFVNRGHMCQLKWEIERIPIQSDKR